MSCSFIDGHLCDTRHKTQGETTSYSKNIHNTATTHDTTTKQHQKTIHTNIFFLGGGVDFVCGVGLVGGLQLGQRLWRWIGECAAATTLVVV